MKAFRLIKILPYGMLLFSLVAFSGCSGNPMATSPEDIDEGIANGEYVKLSKSSANQITRGKNVFETVMKKYQPVIDFYGADSEVFQKMVNTNLMMNAESLTSPSEKMFNYDSMALWEDTEIVVEYEDGTREALPAADALTIDGGNNPDWFRNGKKVVGYLVKLKKANEIVKKIADKTETISEKLKNFEALSGNLDQLSTLIKNSENLTSICNTLVTIGNWAGYAGTALSVIQMTGIIDMGPSSDEIINMKLDYIIDMINGMYAHLEYIEARLDEIEQTILLGFGQQTQLKLREIINNVNGILEELQNAPSEELKYNTVEIFRNQINGYIDNYIYLAEADYDNYIEIQNNSADNSEYSPIQYKINTPYSTAYYRLTKTTVMFNGVFESGERIVWTAPLNYIRTDRINCTLANFKMINPVSLMPFTYEGLEYLKKLIITRMNINSYYDLDNNQLNDYNSNNALSYINSGTEYIGKLRKEINEAYIMLQQEMNNTIANINGPSTEIPTIKENLFRVINRNTINSYHTSQSMWTTPTYTVYTPSIYNTEKPDNGNYGTADRWNYIPYYSAKPSYQTEAPAFFQSVYVIDNLYPYSPSITISSNDPMEFVKAVTDVTFLDDVNSTIEAYYKAKTNKLLEFAASLAALEIQLAMYLDDEDYAVYAQ